MQNISRNKNSQNNKHCFGFIKSARSEIGLVPLANTFYEGRKRGNPRISQKKCLKIVLRFLIKFLVQVFQFHI